MRKETLKRLAEVIPEGNIRFKESLKPYTTIGVGGFADAVILPGSLGQFCTAIQILRTEKSLAVIGNGNTVLVSDRGFKGAVVQTGAIKYIDCYDEYITVFTGNTLDEIARAALRAGLSGMEWGVGSSRTLGGIIAGGRTKEGMRLQSTLYVVEIITKDGDLATIRGEELRKKGFAQRRHTVCRAILHLHRGDKTQIEMKMQHFLMAAKEIEGISQRRIGPIFCERAYEAGKPSDSSLTAILQEVQPLATGYEGFGFGQRHPNYIFAVEGLRSKDIAAAIQDVGAQALAQQKIQLRGNIKYVGTF